MNDFKDFTVRLKPGWGRRFTEQHENDDGDVLAISPEMLNQIEEARREMDVTLPMPPELAAADTGKGVLTGVKVSDKEDRTKTAA